jgi:hypothetical protein
MRAPSIPAVALLLALASCSAVGGAGPEAGPVERGAPAALAPSAADLDAWRLYLEPKPDEDAWRSIPWSTTLADGVVRAGREGKPLLLWVMNGHPLGCT